MNQLKLSVQEAQELLLLSQSSVYSWIDKGKLQSQDTPGGKIIVISKNEAEEIRNFNLKSRRNKVAKQVLQNSSKDEKNDAETLENSVIEAEILGNDTENRKEQPLFESTETLVQNDISSKSDMTFRLISRIEELAVEAGRFKQLEILRNEEKENVKFWMEKYHELSAELKKKEYEINALKLQIEELKGKNTAGNFLNLFKRR
ncbi:MAG: helix-turn-helix domain-containing protein [Candidatus Gastranaerophilales bacterium]|nr:helix-turn-helix domain-containing protein [Candidatus Gastranaerophilales bacterium]